MKPKKLSLEQEIMEYINYWQYQLRLPHWSFRIKIFDNPNEIKCFAANNQSPNYETAVIDVLNPAKIPADWRGTRDLEVTIVHELLHTRLLYVATPLKKKNKRSNWQLEVAIEVIAKSLVANRRGINPEDLV